MAGKAIGELNGRWAWAFKALMVVLPIGLVSLISLNVWLVMSVRDVDKAIAVLHQQVWTRDEHYIHAEMASAYIARIGEQATAAHNRSLENKVAIEKLSDCLNRQPQATE